MENYLSLNPKALRLGVTTLNASFLQKFLMLLLRHPLTSLLDY